MSLLKRIEKGQSGNSSGNSSDGQSGEGSRLSNLQARRVNAPITSPQAGSYFDLKTRVQNKLLSELDLHELVGPQRVIQRADDRRRQPVLPDVHQRREMMRLGPKLRAFLRRDRHRCWPSSTR